MKYFSNLYHHRAAVVAACILVPSAAFAGPDLLQISIHEKMANDGVLARAKGNVDIHLDQHGHDNHQDLHLHVQGLDAVATYTLTAQVDDDTNLTEVVTFTPDHRGKADLHFREKGPKHPHGHDGHVDGQLPADLMPLTAVHQLTIADTNGAAILTADLTSPDNFDYHVKRDLSAGQIKARLDIHANRHDARLHLNATALEPGAQYSLAVNGNTVLSSTAHDDGHLDLNARLQNSADIFALSSVALLDADSNLVVSTTFP